MTLILASSSKCSSKTTFTLFNRPIAAGSDGISVKPAVSDRVPVEAACCGNTALSVTTAQKIRVLIVDDHVMVRQGLRAVLQSYANIDVVGEAGNGEEAISSVAKLQPTIVVMDIGMPSLDGIAATRLIKMQYPDIAVLGLSVNAPTYHVDAMLKAGAFDVITKENAVDELYSAIQRAIAAIQPILILKEEPPATAQAVEMQEPNVLPAKEPKP